MKLLILDIDDVLLDWTASFNTWLKEIKGYRYINLITSKQKIHEHLNTTIDKEIELINEFNSSVYFENLPYFKDSDILNVFDIDFKVIAITSCGDSDIVKENRKENINVKFNKIQNIYFLPLHKDKKESLSNILKEYNPKEVLYLDDNIDNVQDAVSLGIKGFVYETSFNKDKLSNNSIQYYSSLKTFLEENL